ncbi:MAG: hypothetical protein V5A84_03380, partial [Planctomycetota bacterium]
GPADDDAELPRLPDGVGAIDHIAISAREGMHIDRVEKALLAPYEQGLQACREGRGVLFAAELQEAVEGLASSGSGS